MPEFNHYSKAYAEVSARRAKLATLIDEEIFDRILSGEISKSDFLWLIADTRKDAQTYAIY